MVFQKRLPNHWWLRLLSGSDSELSAVDMFSTPSCPTAEPPASSCGYFHPLFGTAEKRFVNPGGFSYNAGTFISHYIQVKHGLPASCLR